MSQWELVSNTTSATHIVSFLSSKGCVIFHLSLTPLFSLSLLPIASNTNTLLFQHFLNMV